VGAEDQLRFLQQIAVPAASAATALLEHLRSVAPPAPVDTIPAPLWERVREAMGGSTATAHPAAPRRERAGRPGAAGRATTTTATTATTGLRRGDGCLQRVAEVLDEAGLGLEATNDVRWDEVVSVEHAGIEPVYDATVLGVHNFVANGVPVHNSIEQDSDIVILLHRDDVYERESARPGEADLIVAKHRNGPTRDVVVAFQGHYSRFVDMARG
jgi:replicative DNA helicase